MADAPERLILDTKDCNEIIIGDGNCFYRCLSLQIEHNQDNYNYYRQIIYNFIKDNKKPLKDFFDQKENESKETYGQRYDKFIEDIQIDGNYSRDLEKSDVCIALNKKLIIYRNTNAGFEFINQYSPLDKNNLEEIYLLYKNNKHFNIILHKDISII